MKINIILTVLTVTKWLVIATVTLNYSGIYAQHLALLLNKKNETTDSSLHIYSKINYTTFEQFGAKGDGLNDDTKAIKDALNSNIPIINFKKTKAYYKVSDMIIINKVNRKKVIMNGAVILNSDLTKATFLFTNSKNIEIVGGEFGYASEPLKNGGNSQHVLQFDNCQNVLVNRVHIRNSPEMGIAITNCNKVIIQNSLIEHTFRDGTYAHYSANVKYINNKYRNIKDDAMSFHDYGIDSEKVKLNKFGYKQSSNLIARNNSVENAYQGFSSISANNVEVVNNKFTNTTLAGVAIFNSTELYANSTASVRNIKILNNSINNACNTISINGSNYNNYGQASTGRAAIFIASLGKNNQLNQGETKKLTNILIDNNIIYNSGADGFYGKDISTLTFTNNNFYDCSGSIPSQTLAGDVIEITNVTTFLANNNTVVDRRSKTLHQHGYVLNNVSGLASNWKVKGVLSGEKVLTATDHLLPIVQKQVSSDERSTDRTKKQKY